MTIEMTTFLRSHVDEKSNTSLLIFLQIYEAVLRKFHMLPHSVGLWKLVNVFCTISV